MRTNGKTISLMDKTFKSVFNRQMEFQRGILSKGGSPEIEVLPVDSNKWFMYHCLAMCEELGELLKADKRWKTHRNSRYEIEEKVDEIADVFITAINIAIFSGLDAQTVLEVVDNKIRDNFSRLEKEKTDVQSDE